MPAFDGATQEIQDRLLRWLRDDFPRVEASLGIEQRRDLRDCIRNSPIIPIRSGGLAPPSRVYAPDASEPDDLLGALAKKPDPRRFNTKRDLWARFFDVLELPHLPLAPDLYEAVLEKVGKAKEFGVRAVREAILKLATYINNHWGELADCVVMGNFTFSSALRKLAWLPARRVGTMDCAAALLPEDRLYRADELAAYRIRHLVASQIPVLDGKDFGKEMAEGLGLRTSARPLEVLTHFDKLRQKPLSRSSKTIDAVRTSFLDVMRYFGTEEQEPKVALASWLRSREAEHLILVGRQWLRPGRVFLNHLNLSLPGAASVHDDVELARGIEARGVRNGLELFGVREAPSAEDWIAVLNDLARQYGDKPLPEDALRVARGALRELKGKESSWLATQPVWVPTRDGRLVSACNAFLPDDPRLRGESATSLALVEEIREIIDVAQRAGARSLRGNLRDQLHEETIESLTAEHRSWRSTYERRIRSKVFHDALLRVEYEEALREGNAGPFAASHTEHLRKARSLRIRIAERLRVQSLLMPDGALVVFAYEASKFLEEDAETLWINAATARRMVDELVRAVCKMCGVGDMLIVSRLLDVEPEQMHAVLNDDGVAVVPTGRELMATDLASHEGAKEGDEFYGEGGELEWSEHKDSYGSRGGNMHPDAGSSNPSVLAGNVLRFSGGSEGEGRPRPSGATGSSNTQLLEADLFLDPETPRPLSHGSSSPWNPNDLRAFPRRGSSRMRRSTYAYPVPQADYDTGIADSNVQFGLEIQRAAVALVSAYEAQRGKITVQVDGALEGYDLVSGEGAEQRFVKIRGIDGPWTARGIGLTRREIDTSLREGSKWWLYVVEYALDPLRASVLPLQNPLSQTDELRLDQSWRVKSETTGDSVIGDGAPVIGEVVKHGSGRMATVLEVEPFDSVYEVLLKFSDEEILSCVWQSSWRQAK